MERPTIKDKSVLAYVEHLEATIKAFNTETKKKLYRGMQRQLDFLADELLSDNFKLSLKNDSEIDRFLKILKEHSQIIQAMSNFLEAAVPRTGNTDKPKPLSEESAENFLS